MSTAAPTEPPGANTYHPTLGGGFVVGGDYPPPLSDRTTPARRRHASLVVAPVRSPDRAASVERRARPHPTTPHHTMPEFAANPGECPHCGDRHDNHDDCAEADDEE